MAASYPSSIPGICFGQESNWFVSHVEEKSGLFYLQQNVPSISVKYERQMQEIEHAVKECKLASCTAPPPIGSTCIAQFSEDNQWYRGQILSLDEDGDGVEVLFVDYGNGEVLSWKNLKKSSKEFTELPAQAIQCRLAHVEPAGGLWSKEALKLLKELIAERELVGTATHLCKTGSVVVKLYADEDKSVLVAEQLVMAGFAHWKKVKSLISQSTSSTSSSTSNMLSFNAKPGQLDEIKMKPGSYFDLCISFVQSVDSFYCHPTERSEDLNVMSHEMQKVYNSSKSNDLKVSTLKVDDICCAKFSEDGIWYRGLVKQVLSGKKYEIQFIDFGNKETLSLTEIRELAPDFKQLPILGLHCSLYGTKPGERNTSFDDDAIRRFEELTFEKQLVGFVNKVDDCGNLALVLFDTTNSKDGININKELSQLKSVVCDKDVGTSHVKSMSSHSTVTVTPHFVAMQFNPGDGELGYVAYAQSPFEFSCQLSGNAKSLENMMQELNNEYLALKPNENKLQITECGTPCCARYSEDGRFYRAELKQITTTDALIHFVDYGNDEKCRLDELKHLRKEYVKLPKQAFKCKLSGIEPPLNGNFPVDVCARFNDMVMDKEFDVKFIKIDDDGIAEVSLTEKNDRNVMMFDVAKTLIDSGMVLPKKSVSKDDLGPIAALEQYKNIQIQSNDDYLDVMPTHVTNPNEFCCQLLENTNEIDSMMAELEATYKETMPDNNMQFKNGMSCVALYPDDQNWYRALILRSYGQDFDVNYVDYGNTEKISFKQIRPIYKRFMNLPAQAFVCSLAEIGPKKGREWSENVIQQFSNLVLEKQLIACIKLKDKSNLYHIELLDTQTNRNQHISISDVMMEKGLACKMESRGNQTSTTTASSRNDNHLKEPSEMEKDSSTTDKQEKKFVDVKLKANDVETAYIAHVDDVDNIYCQLTKQEDTLYELSEKINGEATSYPPVTSLTKGKPVCSLFSVDKSWYRGEIIMVNDSSNASVRFVDYGNSEIVNVSSMREISVDLLTQPKFGIHCAMQNCGMAWKNEAAKELIQMTADKPLKIVVKDFVNGKYIIDVFDENGDSIAAKLNQPLSQSKKVAVKEQISSVVESIEVNCGTVFESHISFVESLQVFFVQPCKYSEDLNNVAVRMADAESFPKLNHPKIGDVCCARFSEDTRWYRAEIIGINGNEIETLFLDYGNTDVVNDQSIRSLPKDMFAVPRLSIVCALEGATSESDEDIDAFICQTVDQIASVEFVKKNPNGRYDVNVKVNGVAVMSERSRKNPGLHVLTNEPDLVEETAAGVSSQSNAQSPVVIVEFNETNLEVGSTHKAFVSYIITAQEFYVQLEKDIDKLHNIMEKLEVIYGNQPPHKDALIAKVPGVPCAAKYSLDGGWYRAALETVEGPSHAKVRFVDYGNAETVELKDVKILKDELVDAPTFAVKCSMVGDVGSSADFEKHVMDKKIDLKVIAMNGSTYIVDLMLNGKSLNDEVAVHSHSGVPTEPKGYKMADMKEGSTVDVYYLDGKSPSDFHCHLVKYEVEFDKLMNRIAECGKTLPVVKRLEVERPCIGLFSEDGAWYRGKIIELKEYESKVLFVDHGNEEWVQNVNVKEISTDLLELPIQAIKFCLANAVPENADWSNEEIKLFEGKCHQKMLSAEIKFIENGKASAILKDMQTNEIINDSFKKSGKEAAKTRQDHGASCHFKEVPISKGMKLEGQCTFVKANGEVSCQLIKYQNELNELMDDIALYCDGKADLLRSTVEPGIACLALFNEDGAWYRARVVKSKSKDTATVRFVDYGNESICHLANLRAARTKDLELPVTCIDCRIPGIKYGDDVITVMNELCLDQELIVDVKDVMSNELVSGDVSLMQSKELISSLVHKKIPGSKCNDVSDTFEVSKPSTVKKFEKSKLGVGVSEKAFCTSVTSVNEVCFQISKYQVEFDEMMDKIATHCEASQDMIKNPVKGQCCLGKYTVDAGWYRAEVLSVSNDKVKLKYVDYGNEDEVQFEDTRVMIDEFLRLPILCFSCKLHDVHQEDLDKVKCKEWLEKTCVDNEFEIRVVAAEKDETIEVNMLYLDSEDTVNDELYANFELGESPSETAIPGDEASPMEEHILSDEELKFSSLQLPLCEKFKAICSNIDDDLKIHCQPSDQSAELNQLMAHIADYCAEVNKDIDSLIVGSPCFAVFSDDGEWYRAEIVKIDNDVTQVFFVDFGNHGFAKRNQILPITKPFLKLSKACFASLLKGIDIDSLPMVDVVKTWIEELLIGQEVEIEIKNKRNNDDYDANIYFEGNDVAELINEKFGQANSNQENVVVKKVDAVNKLDMIEKDEGNVRFMNDEMVCPTTEKAFCTHIDSLHCISCHLTKYEDKFHEMSDNLQIHCNAVNAIIPKDLQVESACLAKFSQDDQWYRAEVLEVLDDHVKVRFVDYGNTDVVSLQNTRDVPKEFAALPLTSLNCRLHEVHEEDLDVKAAEKWLQETVAGAEVKVDVVAIVNGSYDCILTKPGHDATINDQLYYNFEKAVEENASLGSERNDNEASGSTVQPIEDERSGNEAKYEEPKEQKEPRYEEEREQRLESSENEDEIFIGRFNQQTPKLGAKVVCFCTHVDSIEHISIQMLEFEERFHEISDKILHFCEKEMKLPEKFEQGLACLAKSEDGHWYRAEISEIAKEHIDVYFVDYGNTETILKQNSRAIKKEFASLAAMSVKCQLHDVHSSDVDVDKALLWLNNHVLDSNITVEIIGKIDDSYDVILRQINQDVSVNDLLYEMFELKEEQSTEEEEESAAPAEANIVEELTAEDSTATVNATSEERHSMVNELNPDANDFMPAGTSNDKLMPVKIESRDIVSGSVLLMHLSFAVSPSLFWCQFNDSADDLLNMMAEINEHYSHCDSPSLKDAPEVGSICCAKFSADNEWYRGEIIEKYDDASCMILFIDYGNAERVELNQIKELKPEFLTLKKQAIKCSLHGVKAVDGDWSEEAVVEFEDICADKILEVEVIGKDEGLNVIAKVDDSQLTVNQIMILKEYGTSDVTNSNGGT